MRRAVWVLVMGIVVTPALGGAQDNGLPGMPAAQQGGAGTSHRPKLGDAEETQPSSSMQERLGIARMNERQRLLIADTDKLVELALALKKDVDKTDKNMLSLDVVKRAEAIEKLARSVKEREKGQK